MPSTSSNPKKAVSTYGKNTEGWDFFSVTDYTFEKEIYRGSYNNREVNDQLYIWAKQADLKYLEANLENWMHIDEEVTSDYHKITVKISLEKKYPLAIVYVSGSEDDYELSITECGNISELEAGAVEKLNEKRSTDQQIDIYFGTNNIKSLFDAMSLGMKFQRFVNDMEELDYVMVSTIESGLVTEIPWPIAEEEKKG